ncbi:MAG: hypothetical protein IIA45_12425 [Bacteroidetes bacterium]|nr:hypothetical protein [Bacteroidota bacterium]
MKQMIFLFVVSVVIYGCKGKSSSGFYSGAMEVVESFFEAARTGQLSILRNLCDPLGENDYNTKAICELADKDDPRMIQGFGDEFGQSYVNPESPAEYRGKTARIHVILGGTGKKRYATLEMIKREDQWYLFKMIIRGFVK